MAALILRVQKLAHSARFGALTLSGLDLSDDLGGVNPSLPTEKSELRRIIERWSPSQSVIPGLQTLDFPLSSLS